MMRKQKLFATVAIIVTCGLTACQNLEQHGAFKHSVDTMTGKRTATESRLSTSAAAAIAQGRTKEALTRYKTLYKKRRANRANKEIVMNYAQLLRKTGQPAEAIRVLKPFTMNRRGYPVEKVDPMILTEYSAAHLALGDFATAEKGLNRVLEDKSAAAFHHDAYNLLGVVLDAQGNHKEAEQLFRMALDGWQGDPTSVMNNLALSLASSGNFDKSLSMLRKALVMAPDKEEIARNIQIVNDVRDSIIPKAPINIKKM